jgi:hypothetical protein
MARPLPQNAEAERSVLGAILLDNKKLDVARATLKPEDFFQANHARIFTHMIFLREQGRAIDLITLADQLAKTSELEGVGGAAYISQLVDGVPRISNVEHYARIVRAKSSQRTVIHAANKLLQDALETENTDALLDRVGETITALRNATPRNWTHKFHTVEELPVGEPQFLIDGILPEGVTFVGALSGDGKTWFCASMSRALTTGKPFLGVWKVPEPMHVLYLVPEMDAARFGKRCRRFGISGERFRCMTLSDGEPLDLGDPLLAAAIRELKPVTFLDTAIRFSNAEEENSASQNAQGLAKAIFRLLHLGARAVVCLHHRAKGTAASESMTLENSLRGSGDLGAMADAVWGLQYDRGDGSAQYLKDSRRLVRLVVRCVKARDFSAPEDFRVQLDPYLDETGDLAMLPNESVNIRQTELERLDAAVTANSHATKVELEKVTNIGRNRIEGLARELGWIYRRGAGWQKGIK